MLGYFSLILICQLAGEVIVRLSGVPIPGPVIGMALLFLGLLVKGGIPDGLAKTADALLGNLSLLFVPAGVGVMLHTQLLGRELVPIAASIVLGTLITIAVTALVMSRLSRKGTPT